MKTLFSFFFAGLFAFLVVSCNSSKDADAGPATFCDTACNNDTIKFAVDTKEKSFVTISMKDCEPDSITWGNQKMNNYRQLPFADMVGKYVHINHNFIKASFYNDNYVWLIFNECENGQGYVLKLPFNEKENIFRKNTAFNAFDPKYAIDTSMIAHTDKGNIFVEDMGTGKKAMMTFGEPVVMEYDNMHVGIDSVNITPKRIWARVKIGKKWQDIEKAIVLE